VTQGFISVVVPVYNGEATLGRCLDTLLAQTWPHLAREIIVVENGSTDRTTDIVRSYGDRVRLLHSTARGPAAARQMAIPHCRGEIIAFTDADCYAKPDWLAQLAVPFADPDVGGVGGAVLGYTHSDQTTVEAFLERAAMLDNRGGGDGEFMPRIYTCNAAYRKTLLEKVGGFDTRMLTGEDVELSWRMQLQTGTRLAYAPEAHIYHHHRATRAGMMKQFRQYGFGEVVLDTLFGQYPGYPRSRRWQLKRIAGQVWALPRYAVSILLRTTRRVLGRATYAEAEHPLLWLLAESNNILGKLDAVVRTRGMTDARPVLAMRPEILIDRFFQHTKE
jgi:glycosyltransferase involved in cell wall biosynthesis